ncbi:MAG: hypothetical protein PWQ99_1, partial [Clostridia bacterium]|nr:hypothetical protein [Clostridia bacterium]
AGAAGYTLLRIEHQYLCHPQVRPSTPARRFTSLFNIWHTKGIHFVTLYAFSAFCYILCDFRYQKLSSLKTLLSSFFIALCLLTNFILIYLGISFRKNRASYRNAITIIIESSALVETTFFALSSSGTGIPLSAFY